MFDKINFLITKQQIYDEKNRENLWVIIPRKSSSLYVAKIHEYIFMLFQTMYSYISSRTA